MSATLDVPVSLSDAYISSALYVEQPELPCPLPWLSDVPPSEIPQDIRPHLQNPSSTILCNAHYADSFS